eukprot:7909087-Alexandrium_andersonii.AAC.1
MFSVPMLKARDWPDRAALTPGAARIAATNAILGARALILKGMVNSTVTGLCVANNGTEGGLEPSGAAGARAGP